MDSTFQLNKMSVENNRLVERVAFCSILCAGFVYAGYSFVIRKRGKKKHRTHNSFSQTSPRMCSRSTQTENADERPSRRSRASLEARCVSPKSVRERVSDLNCLRKSSIPISPEIRPPGFHSSQWNSPLGCAKYLSVSAENISCRPLSPRCKELAISHGALNVQEPPAEGEADVLRRALSDLQRSPGTMTAFQVRSLCTLMRSTDEETLLKTLGTVSNCAAFSVNQDLFCDSECPKLLKDLLLNHSEAVKISATQAIANIAVRDQSYRSFQPHASVLLHNALNGRELLKSLSLTALANLALDARSHRTILKQVQAVCVMARSGTPVVQLQALRLLVNLSCNKDAVPVLLLSEIPPDILDTILQSDERELVLRILTFLANVASYAAKFVDGGARPTLLSLLYSLADGRSDLRILEQLTRDSDESTSVQAGRLHQALAGRPQLPS